MHNITEIDTVLCPEGSKYRTWHGLEKTTHEPISLEVAREFGLMPVVRKVPLFAAGSHRPVDNFRALVAEAKIARPKWIDDLSIQPDEMKPQQVVLDVVTDRYSIIQNETVFKTMRDAFRGTGLEYSLSCLGTLGGLKKFFISVAVGDDNGGFMVNGDKFYGNVNFITSHNGGSFHAHDSLTRIVCENTLRASMGGQKNVDFKIRHKGDTSAKCADLSLYLNKIFTSREIFIENMEVLASKPVSHDDIKQVVGGFFVQDAFKRGDKLKEGFKTRTLNAIDGITDLAISGRGNAGQTFYDVLNGATEYWTSGDGVGQTASAGKKAYSSEFGTGAANKERFSDYLINDDFQSSLQEETKRVLALSY